MDSEAIKDSVVTDKTVTAKIFSENQWCHYGKGGGGVGVGGRIFYAPSP